MTPGLFKRTPGLHTIVVLPKIWLKWCEANCTQWEPNDLPRNFRPGVALVVCQTPYHNKANEKLQRQMVTSMAVVYMPEHWQLATFAKTAFVIAKVKEDTQGILSLTWLHKDVKFYLDINFADYKQHMTVAPLTLPGEDGLELCGLAEDFAASALHW